MAGLPVTPVRALGPIALVVVTSAPRFPRHVLEARDLPTTHLDAARFDPGLDRSGHDDLGIGESEHPRHLRQPFGGHDAGVDERRGEHVARDTGDAVQEEDAGHRERLRRERAIPHLGVHGRAG